MHCPDPGVLRASLDDAHDASAAPLHDHVRTCASCRETLNELRRNAELAAPAIAMTAPEHAVPPEAVEAALARLESRRARLDAVRPGAAPASSPAPVSTAPTPVAVVPLRRRGPLARLGGKARGIAAALIATVVLTGLVATPGGRAAAAGFLAQFRGERFEVVSLNSSQAMQLSNVTSRLVETGVFSGNENQLYTMSEPVTVRDAAEASRLAGFDVRPVDRAALPRGVAATPERIFVVKPATARIEFDRDRALAYFKANGRPDVQIPERFDTAALVVHVPAIVVQQYAGRDGAPRLLVGKAGMIGLDADGGASLDELRNLVLSLPGLPSETVEQLRNISDWRTTLPLPVPADQVRWRTTNVNGAEAISFADQTRKLHALLWQRGGNVLGVAGVVSADEARHVADSVG